jgi:4-hydroxyphenylpyruvate dioxygenase
VLDTFHILARGTDLNSIRSILKHLIFLVPVAEPPLLDMVPVEEPPLPVLSGTG